MLKTLLSFLLSVPSVQNTPVTVNNEQVVGNIEIQLQDDTGNWRTCHVTRNIPAMIVSSMRQVSSQYPGKRVRAVTTDGRIVDIL